MVKNQLLRQTFYQFGPIPPHFCGNLIKKKTKKKPKKKTKRKKIKQKLNKQIKKTLVKHLCQVASPGGRRLSTEVIIVWYKLLNLMDIVVLYCGDMNMKRHIVIILSKVSC